MNIQALHPLLLAAVDLAVGGVLYRQVSLVLGLLLVAAGVLVLCGIAFRAASRSRAVVVRRLQQA